MDSKASRLLFLTSDKSRSLFKMRSNSCHDGQIHTLNIIHSFSHNISLILTVQKNILFSHAIKFTEPGGGGEMRNSAFGLRFHKTQLKKKKKKSQCRQSLYVLQHYPVHFGNLSCACAISWAHPDESYSAQHRLHIGDLVMGIAKKLPVTSC